MFFGSAFIFYRSLHDDEQQKRVKATLDSLGLMPEKPKEVSNAYFASLGHFSTTGSDYVA